MVLLYFLKEIIRANIHRMLYATCGGKEDREIFYLKNEFSHNFNKNKVSL